MPNEHGGKRSGSGRKRKKTDLTLQNALAEAVPYEKWVSIFTNIANIADQTDDKRAALMAARELAKLNAAEKRSADKPSSSSETNTNTKPQPFKIIYENYNHRPPRTDADLSAQAVPISVPPRVPPTPSIASPHLPTPAHPRVKPKPRPILPPPSDARFWQSITSTKSIAPARPSAAATLDPKGLHTAVYPPRPSHPPQLQRCPLSLNPSGLFALPRYSLRE